MDHPRRDPSLVPTYRATPPREKDRKQKHSPLPWGEGARRGSGRGLFQLHWTLQEFCPHNRVTHPPPQIKPCALKGCRTQSLRRDSSPRRARWCSPGNKAAARNVPAWDARAPPAACPNARARRATLRSRVSIAFFTSESNSMVQGKGWAFFSPSMRRKLCTMLPLPRISTPRSRNAASSLPSSTWRGRLRPASRLT